MEVDQVANGKPVSTLKDTKLNKNLPFVERYRPSGLEDIISHTEIVQTSKYLTPLALIDSDIGMY